jgi:hypothetical protein
MNNPQRHRTNSYIRARNEKTVCQYSNKCIRQITFLIFSLRIHKNAVFFETIPNAFKQCTMSLQIIHSA